MKKLKLKIQALIKRFFRWVFADELANFNKLENSFEAKVAEIQQLSSFYDISADVDANTHRHSPSWAVISLQGEKADYIRFFDLGDRDLREISQFLRRFNRDANMKIDARPGFREHFLKFER